MMKRATKACYFLCICALTTTPAFALDVGDPAPPLKIAEWIRGRPVEIKHAPASKGENKTSSRPASTNTSPVLLLEFWATWCAPCRQSIPHLSKLQKEYKDKGLVVVGVSDESPQLLKNFVEQMKDDIDYTIAADKRMATFRAYLGGFGVNGIPYSVVVNRAGKIAWHGSPGGAQPVIEAIFAGTYSLKARVLLHEYFDTLIAARELEDGQKKNEMIRQAHQKGEKMIKLAGQDHNALDLLAWNILNLDWLENRDRELAGQALRKALKLTHSKNPVVLDTYAGMLWDEGQKAKAVEQLKKAVKLAEEKQLKSVLSDRLERYQSQMN